MLCKLECPPCRPGLNIVVSISGICASCLDSLPYSPWDAFREHPILFSYAGLGKELIRGYKFEGRRELRRAWAFSYLLGVEEILRSVGASGFSKLVVVPVPSSAYGMWKRGFDPVLDSCRYLGSLGIGRLLRVFEPGSGASQKLKSRDERLADASPLPVRSEFRSGLPGVGTEDLVCILDDVTTTGATLRSAAAAIEPLTDATVRTLALAQD